MCILSYGLASQISTFCPLNLLFVTRGCHIRKKRYDIVYDILWIMRNIVIFTISQTISYILGLRNEYIWVSLANALIIFLVCSIVFSFGRKKCNFPNKYNFRFKRCAKR